MLANENTLQLPHPTILRLQTDPNFYEDSSKHIQHHRHHLCTRRTSAPVLASLIVAGLQLHGNCAAYVVRRYNDHLRLL